MYISSYAFLIALKAAILTISKDLETISTGTKSLVKRQLTTECSRLTTTNRPTIVSEKQTPVNSSRRNIDLGGESSKKGIPSTVLNLHSPKKSDIGSSVDRKLTKRNTLMSSSQDFSSPMHSNFIGEVKQNK